MNTLGSWAMDRSYGAGRPLRSGRLVRMVLAPVLPHDTRRIRHIALSQTWHVRIGACLASCKGISRTQTEEGGDCSDLTDFNL